MPTGVRIGILANRNLRRGPDSELISLLREFEPFFRDVLKAKIFVVEGTRRAIISAGLFRHYKHIHCIRSGVRGGIVDIAAMVTRNKKRARSDHLDIAGVQDRRLAPVLACLRGGLVATLITDRSFALGLIQKELLAFPE